MQPPYVSTLPADVDRLVGLTTTVPVEIIYAAGLVPLDLNNVFIGSSDPSALVERAERAGFPKNLCCWVKGIFGAARAIGLRRLVAVVEGDCSNTHALAEMLRAEGVEVAPFAYPYAADPALLETHLKRFAAAFDVTLEQAEAWKVRLDALRVFAHRLDDLLWRTGQATSAESYLFSISCSDFFGDPARYRREASAAIAEAEARPPARPAHRLALIGVPPICTGLLEHLVRRGAAVVFHEVPRQFSMPAGGENLVEQYRRFTYPYDVFRRIEDIRAEVSRRKIEGVIHYVQSFCHRQVQDVLIRRRLPVPVLTLEGDRPGPLDGRTLTRLDAFIEMLEDRSGSGRDGATHAPPPLRLHP